MTAGIVDIPEQEYHRHPALSQSGAKLLLPPSCPALYRWRMDHPPEPHKAVFDFGKAAHARVLGVGQPVRYVDAPTWQTKAAKEARDEAYANDEIPLLEKDRGVIEGMAAALRTHPLAAALLDPARGKAEQSLMMTDPESGVALRGRLDFLPDARSGRMIIPDYKNTVSADADSFAKAAASYGYVMQDPWYRDLVTGLGLAEDVSFVFVLQEKEPPYLVNVVELDAEAIRIGRGLNRRAIQLFKKCTETNHWPGYSADVELVSLPVWFQRLHEDISA
jgi:hypothetical protein